MRGIRARKIRQNRRTGKAPGRKRKRDNIMKRKNKGFTLVEVIVILVILAILAAVLIPSMSTYINKARDKQIIANARSAYVAAQTLASEYYGLGKIDEFKNDDNEQYKKEILKLAQLENCEISFEVDEGTATLSKFKYTDTKSGQSASLGEDGNWTMDPIPTPAPSSNT